MIRFLVRAEPKPNEAPIDVFTEPKTLGEIARLIGADGIDTVNIRSEVALYLPPMFDYLAPIDVPAPPPVSIVVERGAVMIVDDTGLVDGKPANAIATAIYRAQCVPGAGGVIAGDVFICPDEDFA